MNYHEAKLRWKISNSKPLVQQRLAENGLIVKTASPQKNLCCCRNSHRKKVVQYNRAFTCQVRCIRCIEFKLTFASAVKVDLSVRTKGSHPDLSERIVFPVEVKYDRDRFFFSKPSNSFCARTGEQSMLRLVKTGSTLHV